MGHFGIRIVFKFGFSESATEHAKQEHMKQKRAWLEASEALYASTASSTGRIAAR